MLIRKHDDVLVEWARPRVRGRLCLRKLGDMFVADVIAQQKAIRDAAGRR